jgi:hypothetical protein
LQTDNFFPGNLVLTRRNDYNLSSASVDKRIPHCRQNRSVKGSSTVNARGATRLGLLILGLALSAAVACDAQELLPATHTVVTAASSIESTALTSDDGGGVIAGHIANINGTSAQYMGGGCERERRPNCSRPGRRSTRR